MSELSNEEKVKQAMDILESVELDGRFYCFIGCEFGDGFKTTDMLKNLSVLELKAIPELVRESILYRVNKREGNKYDN